MYKRAILWAVGLPAVLFVSLYVALFVGLSRSFLVVMELPGQAARIQVFAVWESGFLNRVTLFATAPTGGENWTQVRARDLHCFKLDQGRGPTTGDLGPLTASLISARLGAAGVPGTPEEIQSDAQRLTDLVNAIADKHVAAMTFRKTLSLDGLRETDAMIGRFEVMYPQPGERIAVLMGRTLVALGAVLALGLFALLRLHRWLLVRAG